MYRSLCSTGFRSCAIIYSPLPAARTISTGSHGESGPRLLAPTARNLLSHYGLTGCEMPATGPRNILLKEDVVNHIMQNGLMPRQVTLEASTAAVKPAVSLAAVATGRRKAKGPKFTDIELTNMRKVIAKRLTESKSTIPHSYLTASCDVAAISQHRRGWKEAGIRVSVNDYVIKAAALSLKKCPKINVSWNESNFTVQAVKPVDISIAVSTASGLITPIVKDANRLSIPEIAACVTELSAKARAGKLQPHEFVGGSFSISNLGMFGISEFSAVINPPQAAILAVGRAVPVLRPDQRLAELMTVTLSYDARAIGEEEAALFMESVSELLSDPELMIRTGDGSGNRRLSSLIS